jgi:hypothetical protein
MCPKAERSTTSAPRGRDRDRRTATHLFARVAQGADFRSFTLTFNGVLTRNEVVVHLAGDDGVAHVAGAAVGDGDFLHDDTVFIIHEGVACESRQVMKKVLRNGATGVFPGQDPRAPRRAEDGWLPALPRPFSSTSARSSSPSPSSRSTPTT